MQASMHTAPAAPSAPALPTAPPTRATDIWVVIAAYQENGVIAGVVADLLPRVGRVVVVDDGSDDDTRTCALAAGATVLRHPINRGQGAALQTGIRFCVQHGAPYIVTFDADGQHRVADALRLVAALRTGELDVAFGNRFMEHADSVPAGGRVLLRLAVLFSRLVSGVRLRDAHNGLRAFTHAAAAQLDITLDGMAHASEIAEQVHRGGLRYTEVAVRIEYTAYSRAKGQRWSAALRIAADFLIGRVLK